MTRRSNVKDLLLSTGFKLEVFANIYYIVKSITNKTTRKLQWYNINERIEQRVNMSKASTEQIYGRTENRFKIRLNPELHSYQRNSIQN